MTKLYVNDEITRFDGTKQSFCQCSGSGIRCLFDPRIRDYISESLETIFWVKIFKCFDLVSGMEKIRIRDPGWKKLDPGSGINIPDPQHWVLPYNRFTFGLYRYDTRSDSFRLFCIQLKEVCKVENLVGRLEVDKPSVCRRIVKLLAPSYFPSVGKPSFSSHLLKIYFY